MRLSTIVDYSQDPQTIADAVAAFEQAGVDIVWVPEVYTFDAPSLLGFLAARTTTIQLGSGILPIYSRTPTLLAMTAAGVDALSDGRCILRLGPSGPPVDRWPSPRTLKRPPASETLPARTWRSTSGAWEPGGRTSTTPSCAATAGKPKRPRFRTSTSPAARPRPKRPFPMRCWNRRR